MVPTDPAKNKRRPSKVLTTLRRDVWKQNTTDIRRWNPRQAVRMIDPALIRMTVLYC